MEPLKPFEKWLYPSMVLWLAAVLWLSFVVWPSRPFVSEFDSYVAWTLTTAAGVTGVVAYVLARGRK